MTGTSVALAAACWRPAGGLLFLRFRQAPGDVRGAYRRMMPSRQHVKVASRLRAPKTMRRRSYGP